MLSANKKVLLSWNKLAPLFLASLFHPSLIFLSKAESEAKVSTRQKVCFFPHSQISDKGLKIGLPGTNGLAYFHRTMKTKSSNIDTRSLCTQTASK